MNKTEEEINAEKAAKTRPDLVPARAIEAAGRAFAYGAAKHGLGRSGRGTYRDAGTEQAEVSTHIASFFRHWCAWRRGEEMVPDAPSLYHTDCMMAQLSIIVDLVEDPPVELVIGKPWGEMTTEERRAAQRSDGFKVGPEDFGGSDFP